MKWALAILVGVAALAGAPAVAQQESINCAAAVTRNLGPRQTVRDLPPTPLPVLPYNAVPGQGQYKRLTVIGEAEVGLSVYRVTDTLAHMQIFEIGGDGETMLADTPIRGEITELSYRAPGGSDLVTGWCYW